MVHSMIDAQHTTYEPIEDTDRQDALEQADKMMRTGDPGHEHLEVGVALDGAEDSGGYIFGAEQGEYLRSDAVKHARSDVIGRNRCDAHTATHFAQFDPDGVGPTNSGPLAGSIDAHAGVGDHTACRTDIADVPTVARHHVGQHLLRHVHRRHSIDHHRAVDFVGRTLVKGLVAGDNPCRV